jgi:hypothetical protein
MHRLSMVVHCKHVPYLRDALHDGGAIAIVCLLNPQPCALLLFPSIRVGGFHSFLSNYSVL